MSWQPVKRTRAGKDGIWCALSGKDVRITFCPDVIERLKLKAGQRVDVCVGREDHVGRLRLHVGAQSGYTLRGPSGGSKQLAISFRKWDGVMDGSCSGVSMPFKVTGDGLIEATLPYWGQAQKLKAKSVA